jgi:hypothetical protein
MENNNLTPHLNYIEKRFRELIQEADDFFKIELLRQANNRYKKALDFNIQPDMVASRISECERMLKFERKVTYILISIGVLLILSFILLST